MGLPFIINGLKQESFAGGGPYEWNIIQFISGSPYQACPGMPGHTGNHDLPLTVRSVPGSAADRQVGARISRELSV